MQVATTILNQLGGNRFIMMTGSKNLLGSENSLSMHLSQNKAGAKYLKIELTGSDDYKMTFQKKQTKNGQLSFPVVAEYEGVYCDQLQQIFTEVTGPYTKL